MAGELVIGSDGLPKFSDGLTIQQQSSNDGGLSTSTPQLFDTVTYNNDYQQTPSGGFVQQQPQYYYQDGTSAASAAAAKAAADTAAFYGNQINQLNSQLPNLDQQQNIGLQNIGSSYNKTLNRLDEQKGLARRNYDMSTQRNTKNYVNTRGGIMDNVRSSANALQRLLGMAGSGNSSAAYDMAPYAAGRMGTKNLGQAQETFGNNAQSLDLSWGDTQRQYSNQFEDLNQQKYQQENSLKSSIASTRASLLEKIAAATGQQKLAGGASYAQAQASMDPYQQQVNSLLGQITQLGSQYANPIMRAGDVAFNAPTMSQYSLGNGRQAAQTGGAASEVDPTFLNILGGQRDEYGNLIG